MSIFERVLNYLRPQKIIVTDDLERNDCHTTPIYRYAPLIQLQNERRLLEVIVGEKADSYQSMIIAIDLSNKRLVLDELSPLVENFNALVGQTITVHHQNHQHLLKIISKITTWDPISRTLIIDLPEHVEYQPRRQHERFTLNPQSPLNVVIDPIYGAPWHATIDNISLGGLRVTVIGDLRDQLHKNKPLRKCEITSHSGHKSVCKGRVKAFTYFHSPSRRTEISIEFEDNLHEEELFKLLDFRQT
jgi:c-di-GMP-binding flagellar brake protein YcgR